MKKPLEGLLVADFSTLLPGPLATLILAEAGAEVVKVERPGGEDARRFPPQKNGYSVFFALLNRGKTGMVADLKSEDGKARAWDLVSRADILVEQFRPGVMERLGFGYDAVRARNPKIIYCSISGYGQQGPRSKEAGHDINYIGATGLLSLSYGSAEQPVLPPSLIADVGGGAFPAMTNILLALIARQTTGHGTYLDIAMADAMFTFACHALGPFYTTGRNPAQDGDTPRYRLYPTSDGKLVACGALEEHFWLTFTSAIGLEAEFVDDRRDPARTAEAVRRTISSKSAAHWKPIFASADCCVTIAADLKEAFADPHFIERGLFSRRISTPDGDELPAIPMPIAPAFRVDHEVRPFPALD